jgi:hypothetical protein
LNREILEEIGVNIQEESIHKYDIFETTAVGKPEGTFVR